MAKPMLVQERTASAQAARVLGRRYLRVNYIEGRGRRTS